MSPEEAIVSAIAARAIVVERDGNRQSGLKALKDADFARAIVHLGWCSAEMGIPGLMRIDDFRLSPEIAACLADYAACVAPLTSPEAGTIDAEKTEALADLLGRRHDVPAPKDDIVRAVQAAATARLEGARAVLDKSMAE